MRNFSDVLAICGGIVVGLLVIALLWLLALTPATLFSLIPGLFVNLYWCDWVLWPMGFVAIIGISVVFERLMFLLFYSGRLLSSFHPTMSLVDRICNDIKTTIRRYLERAQDSVRDELHQSGPDDLAPDSPHVRLAVLAVCARQARECIDHRRSLDKVQILWEDVERVGGSEIAERDLATDWSRLYRDELHERLKDELLARATSKGHEDPRNYYLNVLFNLFRVARPEPDRVYSFEAITQAEADGNLRSLDGFDMNSWLWLLRLVAYVSPTLGFIGTLWGMIGAFKQASVIEAVFPYTSIAMRTSLIGAFMYVVFMSAYWVFTQVNVVVTRRLERLVSRVTFALHDEDEFLDRMIRKGFQSTDVYG